MIKPKKILYFLYEKLFKINDTPQRVSLGFGLGVFLGIMPGAGPIAALTLALFLRVNRASALLGSLLTNTWLSVVTFLLSLKTGSAIMKVPWQNVQSDWAVFIKEFRLVSLFKLSALKIILPVIVGYLAVAFCCGLIVYFVVLLMLIVRKACLLRKGAAV